MLTTVAVVAPDPAMPPQSPVIKLAIPWPMSSLLDLWVVRVRNQAGGTAKQSGKKAHQNCAPQSGRGSGSGGNPKGESHGQGNDGGS